MNVAISGLTAAGKTTHATLLASDLGYGYVSATRIMLDLAGLTDTPTNGLWFDDDARAKALLTDDAITESLTARLCELATNQDRLVFDTWGMPWFFEGPLIRIFIDSDRRSRTWKCFVSQEAMTSQTLGECEHLLDEKDCSTRDVFKRVHGFDIFSDYTVFDAILSNSHLIRDPSRRAADLGIAEFDPIVRSITHFLLSGDHWDDEAARGSRSARCVKHLKGRTQNEHGD